VRGAVADGAMQRVRAQSRAVRETALQSEGGRGLRRPPDRPHQRTCAEGHGAAGAMSEPRSKRWSAASLPEVFFELGLLQALLAQGVDDAADLRIDPGVEDGLLRHAA